MIQKVFGNTTFNLILLARSLRALYILHALSHTILLWCPRIGLLHPNSMCSTILELFSFFFLFFYFFIFISNNFIDIEKGSTPVQRECTRGQTIKKKNYKNLGNQENENDWFCNAANQSIKVLKKNSFKSEIDFSLSSKHLLYLSL